jgi:hypothetical protein
MSPSVFSILSVSGCQTFDLAVERFIPEPVTQSVRRISKVHFYNPYITIFIDAQIDSGLMGYTLSIRSRP